MRRSSEQDENAKNTQNTTYQAKTKKNKFKHKFTEFLNILHQLNVMDLISQELKHFIKGKKKFFTCRKTLS